MLFPGFGGGARKKRLGDEVVMSAGLLSKIKRDREETFFFFKFVLLNVRSLAAYSVIKKVICYIFQMFIFCLILSFDVILLFY